MRFVVSFVMAGAVSAMAVAAQAPAPSPALPLDPIAAIVDAFQTHEIVALGEGRHNNEQGMAFRLALVRDPRFAAAVTDIVVESGTAAQQDVMDRFVRGEPVPDSTLRHAWQDTTQPDALWDVPMYEQFFRAVRSVNMILPRERQLRVLLGDPPFDWSTGTHEQWLRIDRDGFAAGLVQREVLARHRRALLIYGDEHFARQSPNNLVGRLEASTPKPRIFSITTHTAGGELTELQGDVARWTPPALARLTGTVLGAAPSSFYRRGIGNARPMADFYDAVLYVGPVSQVVIHRGEIAPALCRDAAYMRMRLARMDLVDPPDRPVPPGVTRPTDALRQYCASLPEVARSN